MFWEPHREGWREEGRRDLGSHQEGLSNRSERGEKASIQLAEVLSV